MLRVMLHKRPVDLHHASLLVLEQLLPKAFALAQMLGITTSEAFCYTFCV